MAESEDSHPLPRKRGRRPMLPDRDTLYQLYVVQGVSIAEIARRYRTTPSAVRTARRRAGLPQLPPSLTADEVATIKRLFDAGVTQRAIAAHIGRSQATVSQVVRRHGWTRPSLPRRRKPKGDR